MTTWLTHLQSHSHTCIHAHSYSTEPCLEKLLYSSCLFGVMGVLRTMDAENRDQIMQSCQNELKHKFSKPFMGLYDMMCVQI